jgi:hypothetical protein
MIIKLKWHKATDACAASYKQINLIWKMMGERDIKFPFFSNTNAQRQLTSRDASQMIEALKKGEEISFNDEDYDK